MKNIIKIVAAIVVIFALVLGGAAFLLVKTINPNDYKTQISQVIKDKTGRDLTISGNIGWSFFPLFGVKAHNIVLSSNANFANRDFLKVDELDVKVFPFSLFAGKVTVSKVILKNCQLTLIKSQIGENNWQDLIDSAMVSAKVKNASSGEPEKRFKISNLDIQNASVIFENQALNKMVKINNLNLESENVNTDGEQFYFNADADYLNSEPNYNGHISLNGNITLDMPKKIYELQSLQLLGFVNGGDLRAKINFAATSNINADLQNQTLDFDNLTLRADNLIATGKVQATNITYAPNVLGNLKATSFDPKPLLIALGLIDPSKAHAFNSASFKLAIQTTSKFLKITNLELDLDDSKISGIANYAHFTDKNVMFNLDANKIDLDRYIDAVSSSPKPVDKKVTVSINDTKNNNQPAININDSDSNLLKILRAIRINGEIEIGDLKLNKMHFNKIKSQVIGTFGDINLKPITLNFYHGNVNGGINVNVQNQIPHYSLTAAFAEVSVQPLFKDATNSNKLSGIASGQANMIMQGKNSKELLGSMTGRGKIALNKGIVYGIDLHYQVDRARGLLSLAKGQKINIKPESNPPKTDIGQLTADFNLNNGIFSSKNILINGAYFTAKGEGTADLNTEQLNLQIDATNDRKDFYLPVKITNTFSDPKITPQIAVITKNVLSDKTKNEVQKQIDKISAKSSIIKSLGLNKKLDKLLK